VVEWKTLCSAWQQSLELPLVPVEWDRINSLLWQWVHSWEFHAVIDGTSGISDMVPIPKNPDIIDLHILWLGVLVVGLS